MKKLFAIIALVAFFGVIASPAIAASFSAPIVVVDDKPKKAEASEKKADATEKKADCATEKKAGCETKPACGGTDKK